MRSREPNYQLLVLFSLLMVVVPLLVYPMQFGLPLFFAALPLILGLEAAYGVLVWRFAFGTTEMGTLFGRVGLSMLYRVSCAALLAITFVVAYETELVNALTLAGWHYLPAYLLQPLAAPWIIVTIQPTAPQLRRDTQRVIIDGQRPEPGRTEPTIERPNHGPLVTFTNGEEREAVSFTPREQVITEVPRPVVARTERPAPAVRPAPMPATNWQANSMNARPYGELTGFDRATRYIGEHGAVHLACVVDQEGLLLSRFTRGSIDADEWAPLAAQLFSDNGGLLQRRGVTALDKVDLTMDDKRIIAAREGDLIVLVVGERQGDETLPVRIHQSLETIARYLQERYPVATGLNAEKAYV